MQHSFIRWASESDPGTPPHPSLPTSFTPDLTRRRNTSDSVIRFSTPQVVRRSLASNHSTPFLASARGNERGSRVMSLTEEGVFQFQMEAQVSFFTGSGREQQDDEDATFGSMSSFSDVSGSPTSVHPMPGNYSLPEMDHDYPSAFDRNRSRSFPTRRRPNNARVFVRPVGDRTDVIAEQDRSMDSGLEAFSEASLGSADSCTSLRYSRLGVSATCILEAVRSMLD